EAVDCAAAIDCMTRARDGPPVRGLPGARPSASAALPRPSGSGKGLPASGRAAGASPAGASADTLSAAPPCSGAAGTCMSHAISATKHASGEPDAGSPSAFAPETGISFETANGAGVPAAALVAVDTALMSTVIAASPGRSTRRARQTLARVARPFVGLLLLDSIAPPRVFGRALLDQPLERVTLQARRDPMRSRRLGDAALALDDGSLRVDALLELLQEIPHLAQLLRTAARESAALILVEHRAHRVKPRLLLLEAPLRGFERSGGLALRRTLQARDDVETSFLS